MLDFSMPTLNSILPFLESICPDSDLCWHIRRARLLHEYTSIWAVFCDDKTNPQPVTFDCEPQLATIEKMKDSRVILCLVPFRWGKFLSGRRFDFTGGLEKLRNCCSNLISAKHLGAILSRAEFREEAEDPKGESRRNSI